MSELAQPRETLRANWSTVIIFTFHFVLPQLSLPVSFDLSFLLELRIWKFAPHASSTGTKSLRAPKTDHTESPFPPGSPKTRQTNDRLSRLGQEALTEDFSLLQQLPPLPPDIAPIAMPPKRKAAAIDGTEVSNPREASIYDQV